MNSGKLNDWLQIVGLAGVIGSLIFVGLQLRQSQAIALSDTYQNRAANAVNTNIGAMSSPEWLAGISKIYAQRADELTMPEAVAVETYIGTILTLIENNHLQYTAGFLPEEHWQRNVKELNCTLTVPLFREIAMEWPFRDSFHAVIADIIRPMSDDTENCWIWDWNYPLE